MSTDRWMEKEDVIHTHNYTDTKKDVTVPFVTTWMNLEGIMLNEVSQNEKEKHNTISLASGL